jgi:hypothetical protein
LKIAPGSLDFGRFRVGLRRSRGTVLWRLEYRKDLPKLDLVGGLEHDFYDFPYIGNVIIRTDELTPIFLRGSNHQPEIHVWEHLENLIGKMFIFNE